MKSFKWTDALIAQALHWDNRMAFRNHFGRDAREDELFAYFILRFPHLGDGNGDTT